MFLLLCVAPPPPRSMTLEWQEASNEQLKELGVSPLRQFSRPLKRPCAVLNLNFTAFRRAFVVTSVGPHLWLLVRVLQVRPSLLVASPKALPS